MNVIGILKIPDESFEKGRNGVQRINRRSSMFFRVFSVLFEPKILEVRAAPQNLLKQNCILRHCIVNVRCLQSSSRDESSIFFFRCNFSKRSSTVSALSTSLGISSELMGDNVKTELMDVLSAIQNVRDKKSDSFISRTFSALLRVRIENMAFEIVQAYLKSSLLQQTTNQTSERVMKSFPIFSLRFLSQ